MPKKWKRNEAFAYFGAAGKNPRWSWSAISADKKTVVLTLWEDEFKIVKGVRFYEAKQRRKRPNWISRPGNKERISNLKWARDHCAGLFRVVYAIAKKPITEPRSIAECYPERDLWMQITHLNEEIGEFRAVSVDPDQHQQELSNVGNNGESLPTIRNRLSSQEILEIENASMEATIRHFQRDGFAIRKVHREYCGWDITVTKGCIVFHLEVKGHKGNEFKFELSPNEYEKMQDMSLTYRVCIVRRALEHDSVEIFVPGKLPSGWILREHGSGICISLGERIAARAFQTKSPD